MSSPEDFMLPCLNKKLFGFDCMGCGMQRSALLVFKGEFTAAFYMYPAIYTLLLFFAFVIASNFISIKNSNKIIALLAIINVLVIVINFILKTF